MGNLFRLIVVSVALVLSGSAALMYQTTWGRMLQRVFGVSDLAIATVLATFFLGLGLGSAAGGRFAKSRFSPARVYAILEFGVAAWALLSLVFLPRLHSVYSAIGGGLDFAALTVVRFFLAVFILLPPTFLMGATLPVLIAAMARLESPAPKGQAANPRKRSSWEQKATWLYGINTVGAVLGAAATGLWLVPTFGARSSLILAAVLSVGAGLITAIFWGRDKERSDSTQVADELKTDETEEQSNAELLAGRARPELRAAMWLAAMAGFASLAGEVLWTRALRLVVQGTTQAFAAMLTVFLTGIAAGSLLSRPLLRRFDGRTLFAALQLLLGVLTVIATFVAAHLPQVVMLVQGEYNTVPHEAWVVLISAAILLLPLTLVLGMSIPVAWRIAGGTPEQAAKRSGYVLAANTLGGLLGSLAAGFFLVPFWGLRTALATVAAIHFFTASAALFARARTRSILTSKDALIAVPLLCAAFVLYSPPSLNLPYLLDAWYDTSSALVEGPTDTWNDNVEFIEEGRNTTVTVLRRDNTLRLFNDGRPESGIGSEPPGFGSELATLGAIPTLFAEERGRAIIIGLGGAHSTAVVLGGPWEQVDVVELEGAVVDAARFLYESQDMVFPLDDERTRLIVDDARAQLVLAEEGSYDAIVSQPSHPWLAGSSALYTVEFFEESKRALSEGGVLSLWSNLFRMDGLHLRRIVASLLEVFPHVMAFVAEDSSFVLAASESPLRFDERFAERASDDSMRPYLRPFGLDDLVDFMSIVELDTEGARRFAQGAEPLTDDRPALEFALAQIPHTDDMSLADLDYALATQLSDGTEDSTVPPRQGSGEASSAPTSITPWLSPETLEALPEPFRLAAIDGRLAFVEDRWRATERVRESLEDLPLTATERSAALGVIRQSRGDVRGAIEAYEDALDDPLARGRLAYLLHDEGLYARLLELDEAHSVEAEIALRAALFRRDEQAARRHLDATGAVASELAAFAGFWLTRDCTGMRTYAEATRLVLEEISVVDLLFECEAAAIQASANDANARESETEAREEQAAHDENLSRLRALSEQQARNVRRVAATEVREGDRLSDDYRDSAALRHYLRALRVFPGHVDAAVKAARLVYRFVGVDEAAELLERTTAEVEGVPSHRRRLRNVAEELDLPVDL